MTSRLDGDDTWTFGTVTAASPLRIRIDGDTSELASTPVTLISGLAVNDRVWCQIHGRQLIVHGRTTGAGSGATVAYYAHTNVTGITANTGVSRVTTYADGSREIVHHIMLTRVSTTYTFSSLTTWYDLGAIIPAGARASSTLGAYGLDVYADNESAALGMVRYISTTGHISLKLLGNGTVTFTWDIGSDIQGTVVIFEEP